MKLKIMQEERGTENPKLENSLLLSYLLKYGSVEKIFFSEH